MPDIQIVNQSTVLGNDAVAAAIPALQIQITRDFASVWPIDDVHLYFKDVPPNNAPWQMVLLDDSDQAGALGYHEMTTQGQPLGKVFVKTDQQYNLSWTVTISHELLEMIQDPWACMASFNYNDNKFYMEEVGDAVEDDSLAYQINGVLVTDFVLPDWFISGQGPDKKYDWMGHLTAPFTLAKGGYIGVFDAASGWSQITAETVAGTTARCAVHAQNVSNRFKMRVMGKKNWQKSAI